VLPIGKRDITISGGVGVGDNLIDASASNTFIGGDLMVEAYITRDRQLKLQVFGNTDQDYFGRRNRFGSGILFRKEFDNWGELFK
jgi:hypothetical protein